MFNFSANNCAILFKISRELESAFLSSICIHHPPKTVNEMNVIGRKMLFVSFVVLALLTSMQCQQSMMSQQFEGRCSADRAYIEDDAVIHRRQVAGRIQCASQCSMEPSCVGYNFLRRNRTDLMYNCELLNTWSNCSQAGEQGGWKFFLKVCIHIWNDAL